MKKAMLISCFNWYKERIKPIRKLLLDNGYEVIVLIADFDHIKKSTIAEHEKFEECTYIAVPSYKTNISVKRIYSHLAFGKAINKQIINFGPDLLYVLLPPNNIARYCLKYKLLKPKTKLILDIIDLWPESFPLGWVKETYPAKRWKKWRDDCIRAADFVFTECDLYQKKLQGVLRNNKNCTLHLFKEQTKEKIKIVNEILKCRVIENNKVRFAYLGSINNIIDINGIIRVINTFIKQGYTTELHIIGEGTSKDLFIKCVESVGCKAYYYGKIFDEIEKAKLLAPCDFAFNMMKDTSEVGLTIKSLDYLSMGLPLLNNIKGDTWDFVDKEHIGVNITANNDWVNNIDHIVSRNEIVNFYFEHFTKKAFLETICCTLQKLI